MKFFGNIGFGSQTEIRPGVWDDIITEKQYFGDVTRAARRLSEGVEINNDISLTNSISIVADAFANEHIFAMRYVQWQGQYWNVTEVEVQRPRLLLRLGGVYNGPKA